MDVGLVLVSFPPHPRFWIDTYDGGSIDLAVSEYLPPDLELTPKAGVRIEHCFLASHG